MCRILESKIESIVAMTVCRPDSCSFFHKLWRHSKVSMYALEMSLTHEPNASYRSFALLLALYIRQQNSIINYEIVCIHSCIQKEQRTIEIQYLTKKYTM